MITGKRERPETAEFRAVGLVAGTGLEPVMLPERYSQRIVDLEPEPAPRSSKSGFVHLVSTNSSDILRRLYSVLSDQLIDASTFTFSWVFSYQTRLNQLLFTRPGGSIRTEVVHGWNQ